MDKFYAIADPTRRTIVELLAKKGSLSATAISEKFTMSMPAISQHLKVLREAKVVQVEKQGQQRIYHLDIDTMNDIEQWSQKMSHLWLQQFDKLDTLLKAEKNKQK